MTLKKKAVIAEWLRYTMRVAEKTGASVTDLMQLAKKQERTDRMVDRLANAGAFDTVEVDEGEPIPADNHMWLMRLQPGLMKDTNTDDADVDMPVVDTEPTVYEELNDTAVIEKMSTEWLRNTADSIRRQWNGHWGGAPEWVTQLLEKCTNQIAEREEASEE